MPADGQSGGAARPVTTMVDRMTIRDWTMAVLAAGAASSLFAAVPAEAGRHGSKRDRVTEIIVHATGGPFCHRGAVKFSPAGDVATMKRFFERSGGVSIHYIVGADGEVAKSVPEDEVAFHARERNDTSIGIELINSGDGVEPYPDAQLAALTSLIKGIRKRWNIPLADVRGHEDVDGTTFRCGGRDVRRKQDPGPLFPWDRFRRDLKLAERHR